MLLEDVRTGFWKTLSGVGVHPSVHVSNLYCNTTKHSSQNHKPDTTVTYLSREQETLELDHRLLFHPKNFLFLSRNPGRKALSIVVEGRFFVSVIILSGSSFIVFMSQVSGYKRLFPCRINWKNGCANLEE